MVLKGIDIGKTAVDTILYSAFHTMACMQQCLLAHILTEKFHYGVPHSAESLAWVTTVGMRHSPHHILEH